MSKTHLPIEESLPRRWKIATIFVVGGVLICLPLFFAWFLGVSWSGWGDGATGDAIEYSTKTWAVFFLPLPMYYLMGFVAAISTKRSTRVVLAWVGHFSLMLVMLNGKSAVPALVLFIIIAAIFLVFWDRLLRPKKMENKMLAMKE